MDNECRRVITRDGNEFRLQVRQWALAIGNLACMNEQRRYHVTQYCANLTMDPRASEKANSLFRLLSFRAEDLEETHLIHVGLREESGFTSRLHVPSRPQRLAKLFAYRFSLDGMVYLQTYATSIILELERIRFKSQQ